MTQGQLKCIHCDKWVDRGMCAVSRICPYCGGRMDLPPRKPPENMPIIDDDEEDDRDDIDCGLAGVVTGAAILEAVFNDVDDPYSGDEDPMGGGGSFGGGGADDSW